MAVCAVGCGGKTGPDPAAVPGLTMSTPSVPYAYDSLDDRPVSAGAMSGKPTVLTFVSTGSLPAQAQVDFLVVMASHDAAQVNYALVAIDPRENRELVELYRRSLKVAFPVAMADDVTRGGAGPFGDVTAVPVTIVLDRQSRVVARVDGRVAKSEELRAALRGL